MEKGDISGFGHLACPMAGGDMGRHRGVGPGDKLIGRPGYGGEGGLAADLRVGWRQFFEEL